MIVTPTVGRKVWYRPSKFDTTGIGAMQHIIGQPLDATIIAVWGDRCINLQIIDIMGKVFTKTSATLKQEGDTMPVDAEDNEVFGYAEWMPYQAAQAKKHAAEDEAKETSV